MEADLTVLGLATSDLGVGLDYGRKVAGLARAGAGEGWRRSDLRVGRDSECRRSEGWSAA
jgi:hypothetical protein